MHDETARDDAQSENEGHQQNDGPKEEKQAASRTECVEDIHAKVDGEPCPGDGVKPLNGNDHPEMSALLPHLRRIWRPFWHSDKRGKTISILVTATVLMFATAALTYYAGQFAGKVTSAMQRQDDRAYALLLVVCFAIPVMQTFTKSLFEFLRNSLVIVFFRFTSAHLCQLWLSHDISSKMAADKRVDNPEQVMTQSVEDLGNGIFGLSLAFVMYLFDLASGLLQLYLLVPMMVGYAFFWSAFGTAAVFLVGRPLIGLKKNRQRLDADLRKVLADARTDAELTGLTPDEEKETLEKASDVFDAAIAVRTETVRYRRNVTAVTEPFNLLTEVLPFLLVAPYFFHTGMEIGTVTTLSLAFVKATKSMSMLVQQFEGITDLFSNLERVGVLFEVLDEYHAEAHKNGSGGDRGALRAVRMFFAAPLRYVRARLGERAA